MKPVGQRTVIDDGQPADEDSVLMRAVFGLPEPYTVMSPVHIPRGFTKAYIAGQRRRGPRARGSAPPTPRSPDHDILLVEGTGHAGVGAVIGLSNARVASLLRAPAVIVSEGGVGRPIDEIVLNASHFEAHGVPVAGAIVNKVRVDEQPGIEKTLERGLARHGIPLLGVLPYRPILSNPTLGMVLEGVARPRDLRGSGPRPGDRGRGHRRDGAGPHAGAGRAGDAGHRPGRPRGRDRDRGRRARRRRASGEPRDAAPRPLVDETPGAIIDRALHGRAARARPDRRLRAARPRSSHAIQAADMFAAIVPEDTYTVASEVHDLLVKTHPGDTGRSS